MTDRYVVDTEIIAVLDTQTGLYAGSMFIESAQEMADQLNNPENNMFEREDFEWYPREVALAEKSAPDFEDKRAEFITVLKLMKATGLGVPSYAESILTNWDAKTAQESGPTFEVAS